MVVDHNMATVVNVSVKHIRPEFHDLKEWCEEKNHLYIGRGGVVFVSRKTTSGEVVKTRYPPEITCGRIPTRSERMTLVTKC